MSHKVFFEVALGASQRIRPMLMTGLALSMSLLPVLMSDGTGADVMKRIAAPMVGGTASALLMVLLVFRLCSFCGSYPVLKHKIQYKHSPNMRKSFIRNNFLILSLSYSDRNFSFYIV